MVLFAQGDDQGAGGGLFRLGPRPRTGGDKEGRVGVANKAVAEHPEGAGGIAEGTRGLLGRASFDVVSAKGFILPLLGMARFEKEAAWFRYGKWYAYSHI